MMKTINVIQLVRTGIRRIRVCFRDRHPTYASANMLANDLWLKTGKVYIITECPYCEGFHISRRKNK
jgi:hypothetical protein